MAKKASKPVPEGLHTLTPSLAFNGDCRQAIDFYQKAFGAEVMGRPVPSPDGKQIWHVMLRLGDSMLMMNDAMPMPGTPPFIAGPKGSATASLWVYVDDCDQLFKRATAAGCQVVMPMDDAFWGDRTGTLKDPFGHVWSIATKKWDYTEEEMQRQMEDALKKMTAR